VSPKAPATSLETMTHDVMQLHLSIPSECKTLVRATELEQSFFVCARTIRPTHE
jgi:hypothetical protein